MTSLQKATLDEIRDIAARMCRDYLTGRWKVVSADKLIVRRISGGLSNFLYYVSLPADDASTTTLLHSSGSESDMACGSVLTLDDKNSNHEPIEQLLATDYTNVNKRARNESCGSSGDGGCKDLLLKQQNEPQEVLLRIYGQTHGEDALEAMITESVVFTLLSERNFGPKLHGIFPGGRIEQFIPARPLVTLELSDHKISMKIAERMGEIQSLNIPMSKEPDWIWNSMDRWLKSIVGILNRTDWIGKESIVERVRDFDFCAEAKWLKSIIDQGEYQVLFCHNDLQEGNILLRDSDTQPHRANFENVSNANVLEDDTNRSKRSKLNQTPHAMDLDNTRDSALSNNSDDCEPDLIIIDFEYCAYNYRGFDLANHFLEWTLDYSNPKFPFFHHHKQQYPSEQQRHDFIVTYLKKLHENDASYSPSVQEVDAVQQEVRIFSMFSHLFWSLWSVVNVTSNIEFGYWEYALERIQEFQLHKQEYMQRYTNSNTT